MDEPWEKPDSVKNMEELSKKEDGMTITVSKEFKCNWDDHLWSVANKLFGWIWRK